ncbi:hypothetical protein HMN09_00682300 [Mycena chlorophos]|uniref:Uncharacterized protein n=1 Tax=Mycena chlorophos TaxID=658473 RepID=A0A8H6T027_MYCCL|nr:hypothetical protein HMN09_00682300 [Mycena chlorophos]
MFFSRSLFAALSLAVVVVDAVSIGSIVKVVEERDGLDSIINGITSDVVSVATQVATDAESVATKVASDADSLATGVFETVTSIGGEAFTVITSVGGDAITLASEGAGIATSFAGSVYIEATGKIAAAASSGAPTSKPSGSAAVHVASISRPLVVGVGAVAASVLFGGVIAI